MKKYISTLFTLALLSLGMAASDFVNVVGNITYSVTKSSDSAWAEADGVMTSTNFTANTTDKYTITFESATPVVFSTDYLLDTSTYSHLYFYHDGERDDFNGVRSGTYSYFFASGSHTMDVQFYRTYGRDNNYTDCAELSNMKLSNVEELMMSISTLTPGTLGVEALGLVSSLPDMQYLRIGVGSLNTDDWATLKKMTSLQYLDISGTSVTEIPASQFEGTVLKTIVFPNGLKSIGSRAFYNSMLKGEYVMPEGLESIGKEAFYCSTNKRGAITKFTFPTTLTAWDYDILRGQGYLTEVDMNGIALATPSGLFYDCTALTTVRGTQNIKNVGQYTFYRCDKLTDVGDLQPVTAGDHAFYHCIVLPSIDLSQLTTAATSAFDQCYMLGNVDLSSLVSMTGNYAFANCDAMTVVTLPDGFTTFSASDFAACDNLEEVTIGASVAKLSNNCFGDCPKLKHIYVNAPTPPAVGSTPFNTAIPTTATLYVPDYAMVSYKLDSYWSKFTDVQVNPHVVSQLSLSGALTLTSGVRIPGSPDMTLNNGAQFTINGDYSQTLGDVMMKSGISAINTSYPASTLVSRCANLSAEGDVQVSEYIYSGYWYFLSLPFDVLFDDITCASAFVVRRYDGAARAANGTGYAWTDVTNGETLQAGVGYAFRVQTSGWLTLPATSESKGGLFRSTNVTTALNENASAQAADAGWNLVGNPYPAFYDIYYMDYTAPITVWNEKNSNYTAYSIADDNLALMPFQAFFVQRPQAIESIVFDPQGRQHTATIEHATSAPSLRNESTSREVLTLELSDGTTTDRTRIVRNIMASDSFEPECDATKMMSMEAVPQLYSHRDGMQYAINEGMQEGDLVWLGLLLPEAGTFTLEATRNDMLFELYDLDEGKKVTLDTPYAFSAEAGEWNSRFVVRLGGVTAIDAFSEENGEKILFDLMGRRTTTPSGGIYIWHGKKVIIR